MKKKLTSFIASLLLACAMTLCATGCDFFLTPTTPSQKGSHFPYDAALTNGYTQSESAWLASQYTSSSREHLLYEEAKKEGYTGSYVEFLKEIGSAYQDESVAANYALASSVKVVRSVKTQTGTGTVETLERGAGVIYSLDKTTGDALILTNYHVVFTDNTASRTIYVYLYGAEVAERAITATIYGYAVEYDLAILKVSDCDQLKETATNRVYAAPADFGNSDAVAVGEKVFAVGNPNGSGISVTGGVISVVSEYINIQRPDKRTGTVRIQEMRIDAMINHGNSGGGLYDTNGVLVGLVNARLETNGLVGFYYAIPINLVYAAAKNIVDNYASAKGFLYRADFGAKLTVLDSKGVYNEEEGRFYIEEKVAIESLDTREVAVLSGLKKGDIILSATVNGGETVYITRDYMLQNVLLSIRFGDTLTLQISRNGEIMQIDIRFSNRNYFDTVDTVS